MGKAPSQPSLDNIGDDEDAKAEAVVTAPAASGQSAPPAPAADAKANAKAASDVEEKATAAELAAARETLVKALDAADEKDEKRVPTAKDLPVPETLADALEMHQDALTLPSSSKSEIALKSVVVAHTSKHLHRLQQGVEAPVMSGEALSHQFALMTKSGDEYHLKQLCYQYPVVAALVKERDDLKAELAKFKKK